MHAHSVESYTKSYETLTSNPAALTDADVAPLAAFSAAHAEQAQRHIAARTPAPRLTPELAMNGAVALLTALAQDDVLPDLSPVANGEYSPAIVARCELKANHKEFLTITDEELKHCATRDPQLAEQWAYYRREARWAQRAAKAQPPRSAPPTAQGRRDLTPGEEAAITERMKSVTRRIGDALGKSIEKGDGEPFYDALWDAYASTHSRLEAGTVLLCAISHLAFFAVDVNVKNQQRNQKIKALEEQIAQQKNLNLADCYRGSWDGATSYRRGELTTRQGSLWLAQKDTVGIPPGSGGPDVTGWTLVVKAGRDARP